MSQTHSSEGSLSLCYYVEIWHRAVRELLRDILEMTSNKTEVKTQDFIGLYQYR